MFKYAALLGVASTATVSRAELKNKLKMFRVQVRETDAVAFGNRVQEFQSQVESHVVGAVDDVDVQNQMWWLAYHTQVVAASKPVKDMGIYMHYLEESKRNHMFPSDFVALIENYKAEEARF